MWRKANRSGAVYSRSKRGRIHGAVRWYTSSRPTVPAMAGTIWMAEAPVPMTATRLPARSASWFHRAEWKISPSNPEMPSMSGSDGSHSAPTAEITTLALYFPRVVATSQRCVVVFQRAVCTSHPKTVRRRTSYRSATERMYAWISGWGEKERVQPGLRANE